MNRSLRKLLTGNNFPQEYLCLAENVQPLHLSYILETGDGPLDVSKDHLLLGYKPALLCLDSAILTGKTSRASRLELSVVFPPTGEVLARMSMERIADIRAFDTLALFHVRKAWHRFNAPLQQYSQYHILDKIRGAAGGMQLSRTDHNAVRIGYALPRKISLVTLADENRYNLFPTDLHGKIEGLYVDSLRCDGLAAAQVWNLSRMVISHVSPGAAGLAYSLGRNHMQPMKSAHHFPFEERKSKTFGWPLPKFTEGYDELELASYIDSGIHRIFYFRIVHSEPVQNTSTLAHMHAVPASWLSRHNIPVNYLLRSGEIPVKSGS